MKKGILIVFILFYAFASFSQNELVSIAEKSNYESTANYNDVMQFVKQLKKASKFVGVENIGFTHENKQIPLLIISNPLPKSPEDLKNDKRIVYYIQANIHAGEVEGKEAALMFARDILKPQYTELLKNVVILIVPNLNADGNEKISVQNRTNQNGPKNGVGLRHNSLFLDLNRDAMKLETNELRAVITNVINRWNPHLTLDCHTTNGVYRQEPVTFTWMNNPNGNRNLINYMRDDLMPKVSKHLTEQYKIENCFYGEFNDMQYPDSGYVSYASEARYFVNYLGVRNRLAVLDENYVYADYKSRILGNYALMFSLLEMAVKDAETIKNNIKKADEQTLNIGLNPQPTDLFATTYIGKPTPEKILVRTYEVEPYTDENGRRRMKKTDIKKDVWVDYVADYFADKSTAYPFAYLLTISDSKILDNLKTHGIVLEKLTEKQSFEVEEFNFTELKPESRINQGHYLTIAKGNFKTINKEFEKDTYLIRTSQKLGNLIVYLLEPQADDGLLLWNFFDKYLVPQWGNYFYPYPVYKILKTTEIKSK